MRDQSVVIGEMLEGISVARECCGGKTFEQFASDRIARLAAERALEIVSEASRHLSDAMTLRHPHILWPKIRAIGNVLRHEYHRVAPKIIWDVVAGDLDDLERALLSEQKQ